MSEPKCIICEREDARPGRACCETHAPVEDGNPEAIAYLPTLLGVCPVIVRGVMTRKDVADAPPDVFLVPHPSVSTRSYEGNTVQVGLRLRTDGIVGTYHLLKRVGDQTTRAVVTYGEPIPYAGLTVGALADLIVEGAKAAYDAGARECPKCHHHESVATMPEHVCPPPSSAKGLPGLPAGLGLPIGKSDVPPRIINHAFGVGRGKGGKKPRRGR
jgi:hypothetical protein